MIIKAMRDEALPVYGDGMNVRDWIHVEDHCAGIVAALFEGKPGAIYNFGGDSEMVNLEVVKLILKKLGKPEISSPSSPIGSATTAVTRSIPPCRSGLKWKPRHDFEQGLDGNDPCGTSEHPNCSWSGNRCIERVGVRDQRRGSFELRASRVKLWKLRHTPREEDAPSTDSMICSKSTMIQSYPRCWFSCVVSLWEERYSSAREGTSKVVIGGSVIGNQRSYPRG